VEFLSPCADEISVITVALGGEEEIENQGEMEMQRLKEKMIFCAPRH
jgi:hypothetical protein